MTIDRPTSLDAYERYVQKSSMPPPVRWADAEALSISGAPNAVNREIEAEVERQKDELLALSHDVHAHPELNFEERYAAAAVAGFLEARGHQVKVGTWGLDTAFLASVGDGGPHVAILAEYDALPEIGHGCGHNVICAAAVGAFIGLAPVISQLGGQVSLFGTPAEEGGGGKEFIARSGAFDDVDAAIMVHPADNDLTEVVRLGMRQIGVIYRGISSHAAASPFMGRNALDAAVMAYQGVAQLRQHMLPAERLHMVITDGGVRPYIIPETAAAWLYVRSPTIETLDELTQRVLSVLHAAASATTTTAEIDMEIAPPYVPVRYNRTLGTRYVAAMRDRGRAVGWTSEQSGGSTDLGNVSVRVPSIHPNICIAPPGIPPHSHAFTAAARSEAADVAVIDGAVALARTAADYLVDPELRAAVSDEFLKAGGAVDVGQAMS